MLLCYALNVKLNCANYTTIFIHIYYKRGVLLVEAGGGPFLGPRHENSICQQCHRSKNIGRSHTFLKPILSNDSTQNSNNISDFFCTIMIPVQNWCSFCHIFSIILHAPHTKQMKLILDLAQLAMTIISEREGCFISTIILVLR